MTTPSKDVFTPETFSVDWTSEAIDLLDIPLNFPYSTEEWDAIFDTFIGLLSHPEYSVWHRAINALIQALEIEVSQRSDDPDYQPRAMPTRLGAILEALRVAQVSSNDQIFATFCSNFQFLGRDSPYQEEILKYLAQLLISEDHPMLSKDSIVAAQIFFGEYDTTWTAVGETLIQLLDHEDLNLRACAAYQIGKFYSNTSYEGSTYDLIYGEDYCEQRRRSVVGMPLISEFSQLIRDKEIQRPGIAGAFWGVLPKHGIDYRAWVLDVFQHSTEPEPYIPYFPGNLMFDAHERFSRDPEAIRQLMTIGRFDIAIMAATEESSTVIALEPLLVELGYQENVEFVRLASWQLAYYYHRLHPKGVELGYVECIDDVPEIDILILHVLQADSPSPYAVVIYPKAWQPWNRSIAQKWVDQIFPATVRGESRYDLPSPICDYYQCGYIDYQTPSRQNADEPISHVIIGYRSKAIWNPRDFL